MVTLFFKMHPLKVECEGKEIIYYLAIPDLEFIESLTDAFDIVEHFDPLMKVSGSMFLEIFSGSAILTMAMTWLSIPAMRPWDVASNDKHDVLRHGAVLMKLVARGYINGSHLAVPCNSLSWARHLQLLGILVVYCLDKLSMK